MWICFRWSDAYSLSLRFVLPGSGDGVAASATAPLL
jgi:hypothetical protein